MHMSAIAGEMPEWFRHKRRQKASLFGHSTYHPLKKRVPVRSGHRIGIGPVNFELAIRVFMIPGVGIPPKLLHECDHLGHELEISEESAQVVTGFGERIQAVPRRIFAR